MVNGVIIADTSHKVGAGNVIELTVPPPVECHPVAQDIPLNIVYEDDDLIVIDKPLGMVVHPGSGNSDGTLVNGLLHHCQGSLSGINGVLRPGIVHRLDKDTSGLMVVAKNDHSHQHLSQQFTERTLYRIYEALVWGIITPASGHIEGNINRHPQNRQKMTVVASGGKEARTDYKLLECHKGVISHVQCRLHSGRTHQIRVHLTHMGYPVLGDPIYGKIPRKYKLDCFKPLFEFFTQNPGQILHAKALQFHHPKSNKLIKFETNLPDKFLKVLDFIKN